MNIAVCVQRIPKTAEADILIDSAGKDIKKEHLVFALNDWDGYAVREAVLLKEKYEGEVTVITIGPDESKEVLTRCLAMGADKALKGDVRSRGAAPAGTQVRHVAQDADLRLVDTVAAVPFEPLVAVRALDCIDDLATRPRHRSRT